MDNQIIFNHQWNAEFYDKKHAFVSYLATDLVDLLSPKSGEYILDLGCGTGHLTNQIANRGAKVFGIDSAPTMIEQACKNYPNLNFKVMDGTKLLFTEEFDAVFSNAVLHWIKEPEKIITGVWRSLKPGGRFVAEFGGKGNVESIVAAIYQALAATGYPVNKILNPWYFPSIGEYGTLLEQYGFRLTFATLFNRPTPLEDGEQGMQNWIKMFGNNFLLAFPAEQQTSILKDIDDELRPKLYKNGTWFADYSRLRIMAIKSEFPIHPKVKK